MGKRHHDIPSQKGNKTNIYNYLPITLLTSIYKIRAIVLSIRIRPS